MKWLKVGAVIFGAVLITALGIDAADTLSGSRTTLLGQVIGGEESGQCPNGMVSVPMATTFKCVDAYEASANAACANKDPKNELETQENMNDADCKAQSKKDTSAWRFVTREQALTACLRAGKRLPQSSEWYLAAAGTPDNESCNTNGGSSRKTGEEDSCVSAVGIYDAIGNVWEWTSDDVIEGKYQGRDLPQTGYVAQVDSHGMSVLTNETPSGLFSEDYFWASVQGAYGVLRGGFYGSKQDAGVYSVHADTLPTTSGTAIGFRCVL
jgi:formylglycine-generating enzyme required for sulfatase activity